MTTVVDEERKTRLTQIHGHLCGLAHLPIISSFVLAVTRPPVIFRCFCTICFFSTLKLFFLVSLPFLPELPCA